MAMLTSIILTNRGKTGFRLIAITGTLGKISGTTKGVSAFKIEVGPLFPHLIDLSIH
jgi:hypothetical protein